MNQNSSIRLVRFWLSCGIISLLLTTGLMAQTVTLSLPDTTAPSRSLLKLPIWISDVTGFGITSLSFKLRFDPNVLDALGANSKGTISQAWGNPTTSDSVGQMTLAMVGTMPLTGKGILTYVFFDVVGAKDDTTSIHFQSISINEGRFAAIGTPGKFIALEAEPTPNATFSMPDTSGDTGSIIHLPIRVSDLSPFHIDSLRIGLSYNKYVLHISEIITSATMTQGWQDSIETQLPGSFAFFLRGSTALVDSGVLCRVRCELKGNPGMATPIHFQNIACYKDTLRIASRDGKLAIAGGTGTKAIISIPDISADSGSTVIVPVFISKLTQQDSVSAVAMHLQFDSLVIRYQGYSIANTLLDGWFCSANLLKPNQLKFGGFSTSFIVGQGVLVEFTFHVVGRPAMQTSLSFLDMMLNEGVPSSTAFGGVFTVNYVIPVELSALSARKDGRDIVLTWETVSESNNYGFEVERSINAGPWQVIGFVPGHGSTTVSQRYSFRDKGVGVGSYHYRLKQIDTDGHFVRSAAVEVIVLPPNGFSLGQNYPNPFNPITVIPLDLPEPATIKLTLYNLLGEQVEVIASGQFDVGHHQILFNTQNLAAGLYFYKLETKDFSDVNKLVILK